MPSSSASVWRSENLSPNSSHDSSAAHNGMVKPSRAACPDGMRVVASVVATFHSARKPHAEHSSMGQCWRGMCSECPCARAMSSSVMPATGMVSARKVQTDTSRTASENSGQLVPQMNVSSTISQGA